MSNEFVRILGNNNLTISVLEINNGGLISSALYTMPAYSSPFDLTNVQSVVVPGGFGIYDAIYFLNGIANEDGSAFVQGGAGITGSMPLVYDSTDGLWRPKYATNEAAAFAEQTLATGSGTQVLATIDNARDWKALALTFVIAGMTQGADYVQLKLEAGASVYTILLSNIIGQDGTYTLRVSPTLAAVSGQVANDHLPRTIKISAGYSVSGDTTVNCTANWFN